MDNYIVDITASRLTRNSTREVIDRKINNLTITSFEEQNFFFDIEDVINELCFPSFTIFNEIHNE